MNKNTWPKWRRALYVQFFPQDNDARITHLLLKPLSNFASLAWSKCWAEQTQAQATELMTAQYIPINSLLYRCIYSIYCENHPSVLSVYLSMQIFNARLDIARADDLLTRDFNYRNLLFLLYQNTLSIKRSMIIFYRWGSLHIATLSEWTSTNMLVSLGYVLITCR